MMLYSPGTARERFTGTGIWEREARWVALLAAELDMTLDEQTLLYCDVRDLMTLRRRLQRALRDGRRAPCLHDYIGVLAPRDTAGNAGSPLSPLAAALSALREALRRL